MNKTLKILLVIAAIGITIPAMANPENEPIANAANQKTISVSVDGANVANNDVHQILTNFGNQNNWVQGIAATGSSSANSANVGYANSGASSIAANSLDAMGDSSADSSDNNAVNTQTSSATSNSGEATAFDAPVDQSNTVAQNALATITNNQGFVQTVDIRDVQGAEAITTGDQSISDSMIKEDNWTKSVAKYLN